MHLTGWPDGPPLLGGWAALAAATEVAELVADLARRRGRSIVVDVPEVLFGRAAIAGLQRAGRTSAGGSCRLLEAVDGWLAVNLARPDDVDAVPAVVEGGDLATDPWRLLAEFAGRSRAVVAAERCQLLGVPAAALGGPRRRVRRARVDRAPGTESARALPHPWWWTSRACGPVRCARACWARPARGW